MKHAQMLDTMELEQERGITIKLQPVRMDWEYKGQKYILNLIDTPGHVDFSYEVSRSLAACEGAILIVDATQGIEAQTLANCYMAMEHNLTIVPVLNKIDLPAAEVSKRAKEIEDALGIPASEIIAVSAKEGTNVLDVLARVVETVPPPKVSSTDETRALIFDSVYDSYKGVVAFVRVMEGSIKKGDRAFLLNTRADVEVLEVGYFRPKYQPADILNYGEVGYIVTGLKTISDVRVGDTVWKSATVPLEKAVPLEGYKKVKPFVFASIFCVAGDEYPLLRDALEKLSLNDSSLSYEPERSIALGHGFRCGFLGLLHLDIVQERLEREYGLNLVVTAPSVSYKVVKANKEEIDVHSPYDMPDSSFIDAVKEPWVRLEILTPKEYTGGIMKLIQDRRGLNKGINYLNESRVLLDYEVPLSSIVVDFYDKLKSISSGYASMNYEFLDFREGDLVKVDILVSGEPVPPLAMIVHRSEAYLVGCKVTKVLKDLIPRANFLITLQAAIGAKIIARENISAYRKDVTGYLYGGDRSRKDKLLDKQKRGKKRMKMVGKVNVPQEAFMAVLKR
jgi:GTP-binding protein LepA